MSQERPIDNGASGAPRSSAKPADKTDPQGRGRNGVEEPAEGDAVDGVLPAVDERLEGPMGLRSRPLLGCPDEVLVFLCHVPFIATTLLEWRPPGGGDQAEETWILPERGWG